jgi:endoglucanase
MLFGRLSRGLRAPARFAALVAAAVTCGGAVAGCAQDPNYGLGGAGGSIGAGGGGAVWTGGPVVPVGPAMTGLHVVGNRITNSDGATVLLHGVNRSGTEYQCAKAAGFFDGPATLASIWAMAQWTINAVRIPLNEACWLGINGVVAGFGGDNYKQAIVDYVGLLHQFHIVPVLDLHWVGPGTSPADRLQPMPDADHAPAFWADVAMTFAADDGVIFELFNEPFPDRNRDSEIAWTCWRDGCTANQAVPSGQAAVTYQAAGMQALVTAVRATGSKNLLLVGGLQYSNALSQWSAFAPIDPMANTAVAWHVYNFNLCANATCWDGVPAALAMTVPVVVTEFGDNSCSTGIVEPFLQWNDAHGVGYLAWTWNTWGLCVPPTPPAKQGGRPWALIGDFATGYPNSGYAQAYHDHLMALP